MTVVCVWDRVQALSTLHLACVANQILGGAKARFSAVVLAARELGAHTQALQALDGHAESVHDARTSPWFSDEHPHNVYIFFSAKKLL